MLWWLQGFAMDHKGGFVMGTGSTEGLVGMWQHLVQL